MSWLKMGRWALVGAVVVSGASACGGRGNLPGGDAFAGDDGGGRSFGGAAAMGGSRSFGGVTSFGGTAIAGSFNTSGTAAIGGVAGQPGICVPGAGRCEGNSVAICSAAGNGYTVRDCGSNQRCVQQGDLPVCQAVQCKAGQVLCDASGRFTQVCAPDGLSAINKVDCNAQGQRCQDGVCKSLVCQPNQLFCDRVGVRLCNADGSGSSAWQNCRANQHCDPVELTCQNGVCSAGQPACNGNVATTCNASGSGYLAMGTDCASQGRQCVKGTCLCAAGSADCDGSTRTGCEAKISSDPKNCTGCGLSCSTNHVPAPACDDACTGACETGFLDCNADKRSDGCETGTTSDAKNCGGCGLVCSSNHVTASCAAGVCNGACAANFNDCNGSKLKDGCESDSRTDLQNCGSCGTACSTNHLKATCTAGSCGGTCDFGFQDCNGNKDTDGCEIDTQHDAENCGACGNTCAPTESCSGGKCSNLLTFSGVAEDMPIAALAGWTQCLSEPYAQDTTDVLKLQASCPGSLWMLACRPVGSDTLQVAAYAPREDVLFNTGNDNATHIANGVAWYYSSSESWGFAPAGDAVNRNSCDTQDSSSDRTGTDGNLRLCWHNSLDTLQGGWRCGRDDNLNSSFAYERLIFTAP